MSAVPFARPLFAASFVGAVAVVATVASLFSATPEPRRSITPTRAEAKSCEGLLCSWDDLLPTTSTFRESFGPPGLLAVGSFTDCIGCIASAGKSSALNPRGFAFGLTKLHGKGGAQGLVVSEAARNLAESSGSAANPGEGSSGGVGVGLQVASSMTSVTPLVTATDAPTANVPVTVNPEPGTVALLATALFLLVPVIRRQRRA